MDLCTLKIKFSAGEMLILRQQKRDFQLQMRMHH